MSSVQLLGYWTWNPYLELVYVFQLAISSAFVEGVSEITLVGVGVVIGVGLFVGKGMNRAATTPIKIPKRIRIRPDRIDR